MSAGLGLDAGTIVGRDFRVVKHLASGAMGSVYVVDQLSTGKQRAMKVMSIELAQNDRARERFVLEARVGANIDSDHVVEVISAGIDEATRAPYLVMELLSGEELADKMYKSGAMPIGQVTEVLKQAGHALGKAHEQGIVHRDIKPENLFIAESRREGVPFTVKILDFGIAKLVAERTSEGTQPIGTPLFMAPEQTDRRGIISPSSDVWPLGLLAFFMLTGRHYWQGIDVGITALLREVVMEPLAPASQRAAQYGVGDLLPPGFDAWFARCVNRDPSQRFPEAGACVRAFHEMVFGPLASTGSLGGSPVGASTLPRVADVAATVHAPPAIVGTGGGTGGMGSTGLTAAATQAPPQAKNRAPLAVGALVLVAGIGGALYFATSGGGKETVAAAPTATATDSPSAAVAKAGPCPDGMVLIEGGNMFMGSTDADLDDDVRPPHKVTVDAYCLDEHEVTVAAYDKCSGSGDCLRASSEVVFEGLSPDQIKIFSALCNEGKSDKQDHPINCVDWSMADHFCRGEKGRLPEGGARLPTEAEWEFAARGSSQRVFPWGDEPPGPARLNACGSECAKWLADVGIAGAQTMYESDDGFAGTSPVGHFEAGVSAAGIFDLAGNVWEWTADFYGPYSAAAVTDPKGPDSGDTRVVRGGAFNGAEPGWAKPAWRWRTAPTSKSHGIGFRCAANQR